MEAGGEGGVLVHSSVNWGTRSQEVYWSTVLWTDVMEPRRVLVHSSVIWGSGSQDVYSFTVQWTEAVETCLGTGTQFGDPSQWKPGRMQFTVQQPDVMEDRKCTGLQFTEGSQGRSVHSTSWDWLFLDLWPRVSCMFKQRPSSLHPWHLQRIPPSPLNKFWFWLEMMGKWLLIVTVASSWLTLCYCWVVMVMCNNNMVVTWYHSMRCWTF